MNELKLDLSYYPTSSHSALGDPNSDNVNDVENCDREEIRSFRNDENGKPCPLDRLNLDIKNPSLINVGDKSSQRTRKDAKLVIKG